MNKKFIISIISLVAIIIIVAVVLTSQKSGVSQIGDNSNGQVEDKSNQQEELTVEEIQAEIDRIINDPSIDISDWPTFTNTKYGWSIKYHPEGVWSGEPMVAPKEALGASYNANFDKDNYPDLGMGVTYFQKKDRGDNKEVSNTFFPVMIGVNQYLVNWQYSRFFLLDQDNQIIIHFDIDSNTKPEYKDYLVKSLSTVKVIE